MIAAAERADLVVTAIHCAFADPGSISARDATVLLGNFKIVPPAVTALDAPVRTVLDQIPKILTRQFKKSVTTDSRRNALVKTVNNLTQMRLHICVREIGDDQAHPAVDVEPNAAG